MSKILIAIDGSPHSIKAAKAGVKLALSLNMEIMFVTVVDNDIIMAESTYSPKEAMAAMRTEARELMLRMRAVFNCREALCFVEEGKPSVCIVNIANGFNVDMIVVGTHGRSGLKRALMGSVAEEVIRHSHIPVLVIPFKTTDNN
ncbi:MAG: universal stress protein [Bacteroidetes bacterium]|nr:universal stress protein [Bacteroidota bacterium]